MRFIFVIVFLAMTLSGGICMAGPAEPTSTTFVDPTVTSATNPHFSGKFCSECHREKPRPGGPLSLVFGDDFTRTCRCHGYTAGTYIHPVNIVPSPDKRALIPAEFPLQDGKITCATCHEIGLQCQDDQSTKLLNKAFLRGAPYATRTGLCRRCHERGRYKAFDPHEQLDDDGRIIEEKCLYCHVETPDVNLFTFGDRGAKSLHARKVKFIGDLKVLCNRCHPKQGYMHPINADHFREPSAKIRATMRQSERSLGVSLPLDYDGKVTCSTCHNPHERGVIPREKAASKGAGEKYRLRVPGLAGQMCKACHQR